jgi:pimeloyl-ACP methyl ester carboxylesterase
MPYATNKDIRIHYEVDGSGPPLVLQHGFTQKVKSWELAGYVDALRRQYRLIRVDARGHGDSDKPHDTAAYTLSAHSSDVVAVLDALNLPSAHF